MRLNKQLARAAAYWSGRSQAPRKRLEWGHIPQIKMHVCDLIGSPGMTSVTNSLLERAQRDLGATIPFERALSVGCGAGAKELGLADAGFVTQWDLWEISDTRINAGRSAAAQRGLGDRAHFHQGDAFEQAGGDYDLVFWSHSLHHMFDIDAAVQWSLDRLKPGGLLCIDEYVGPNRFQWTDAILAAATAGREMVDDSKLVIPEAPEKRFPRQVRRPKAADVIAADPTESPQSEEILPVIRKRLPTATVIPLGGAVYMVGLNGLLTNFTPDDNALLARLLQLDTEMMRRGTFVLAAALYRKPA